MLQTTGAFEEITIYSNLSTFLLAIYAQLLARAVTFGSSQFASLALIGPSEVFHGGASREKRHQRLTLAAHSVMPPRTHVTHAPR